MPKIRNFIENNFNYISNVELVSQEVHVPVFEDYKKLIKIDHK